MAKAKENPFAVLSLLADGLSSKLHDHSSPSEAKCRRRAGRSSPLSPDARARADAQRQGGESVHESARLFTRGSRGARAWMYDLFMPPEGAAIPRSVVPPDLAGGMFDRVASSPRHPARPELRVAVSAYAISLTLSIRRARLEAALAHVARHVGAAIRVDHAGRRLACPRACVARQAVVVARACSACPTAVPVDTRGLALAGVRAVPVDLAPPVLVAAEEIVRRLTVRTEDHAPRLLSAVGVHTTGAHARRSRAGSRTRRARAA